MELVVIGAGSAAFAAALRAAERGARVTLVSGGPLGGTCVNVGCVPSKFALRASETAHAMEAHSFAGISSQRAAVDRRALVAQQQALVAELRAEKYERLLADDPGIELARGTASFLDGLTLEIELAAGGRQRRAPDGILVATGASPWAPPIPGLAGTPYWTSTEALVAEEVPERLVVIGGGLVAVELAQAFRRLGSEVIVVARSTLLSGQAPELGTGLASAFAEEGIAVALHTVPSAVRHEGRRFIVETAGGDIAGDRLLVATGRRANTARLGLERAGVGTDGKGSILVDDFLRTSAPRIWAAGDCTHLPPFVYVAAAAGTRAAVNMTGGEARLDLAAMPAVVFTDPQAAWVGLSEEEARRRGLAAETRTLSLDQVSRARVNLDTRGFNTVVAEAQSGRLLGVQALAAQAGELIQAAALALRAGMTVEELGDQLFPYLTMVEGLKLAAQSFTRDVHELSCCAG